jgi:hypothetical protein
MYCTLYNVGIPYVPHSEHCRSSREISFQSMLMFWSLEIQLRISNQLHFPISIRFIRGFLGSLTLAKRHQ